MLQGNRCCCVVILFGYYSAIVSAQTSPVNGRSPLINNQQSTQLVNSPSISRHNNSTKPTPFLSSFRPVLPVRILTKTTTATLPASMNLCRIVGSVNPGGSAASTDSGSGMSFYLYLNLFEDTKVGTVIGRLNFMSGRPELVTLQRVPGRSTTIIGYDPNSRNFTLLKSVNAEASSVNSSSADDAQVVFRCFVSSSTSSNTSSMPMNYIFVLFNIIDVNDNAPSFAQTIYKATVNEASPVGTLVTDAISAIDADSNDHLTYWLGDSPIKSYFEIDPETARVIVRNPLDYELLPGVNLTVWVRDSPTWCDYKDHPCQVFSSSTTLKVAVVDLDDHPPVFTSQIYFGTVPATAIPGTPITLNKSIAAFDGDASLSSRVVYSLIPSVGSELENPPYLVIDQITAKVTVARQLPYVGSLLYTLTASQRNNSAKSSVAILRVTIADRNRALHFANGRSSFELDVAELMPFGSRIFYAGAIAPTIVDDKLDSDDSSTIISYSIQRVPKVADSETESHRILAIDPLLGIVTVTGRLTFDAKSFNEPIPFIITATYEAGQQTATADLLINVVPMYSNIPSFSESIYYFNSSRRRGDFVGNVIVVNAAALTRTGLDLNFGLMTESNRFIVDQKNGSIYIGDSDISIADSQIAFVVNATTTNAAGEYIGSEAITVVVALNQRSAQMVAMESTSSMNSFVIIVLVVIAGILLILVLGLGIYLLRSERLIRSMQRRLMPTSIEADTHVKWLHGASPTEVDSAGNIGPIDPAIVRTNEAYQRFLEGRTTSSKATTPGGVSAVGGNNESFSAESSIDSNNSARQGAAARLLIEAPFQSKSLITTEHAHQSSTKLSGYHSSVASGEIGHAQRFAAPAPASATALQRSPKATLIMSASSSASSTTTAAVANHAIAKRRYKKKFEVAYALPSPPLPAQARVSYVGMAAHRINDGIKSKNGNTCTCTIPSFNYATCSVIATSLKSTKCSSSKSTVANDDDNNLTISSLSAFTSRTEKFIESNSLNPKSCSSSSSGNKMSPKFPLSGQYDSCDTENSGQTGVNIKSPRYYWRDTVSITQGYNC